MNSEKIEEEFKKIYYMELGDGSMGSDMYYIFEAGYLLAQKDLQQKLDTHIQLAEAKGKELKEALEVINYYADYSNWESIKRVQWGEAEYLDATQEEEGGVVARKYLEKLK